MTKSRNRAISWIMLVVFSLVIFCSSVFMIVHAEHDCTGEGCSVCTELAECYKMLRALGTAAAGKLRPALMIPAVYIYCGIVLKTRSAHTTLISLKVELLN